MHWNLKLAAKPAMALAVAGLAFVQPLAAATSPAPPAPAVATYADLADLADSAPLVLRAQVRKLALLEPERAPNVRKGWGRFYVEAKTQALISGNAPLGEALRYLVDLPLDAKGKPPKLKKKVVLLFGRTVRGRPGELQLTAPDAQLLWDPAIETRVRSLLMELNAADPPRRVTGVREAIHVPGTLAGEGETQLFLDTADQSAASITVQHVPGNPPGWGVSFSEVLANIGSPPPRDTLAWYRLACFLPRELPRKANLSSGSANRAKADADYEMVIKDLGRCPRTRVHGKP